jgi:hypothetical protein
MLGLLGISDCPEVLGITEPIPDGDSDVFEVSSESSENFSVGI